VAWTARAHDQCRGLQPCLDGVGHDSPKGGAMIIGVGYYTRPPRALHNRKEWLPKVIPFPRV